MLGGLGRARRSGYHGLARSCTCSWVADGREWGIRVEVIGEYGRVIAMEN